MKKLIILLASAGLIAGCARHNEANQGTGGYNPEGTMGTDTNKTNQITPGTGGTGTGQQQNQGSGQTTPAPGADTGTTTPPTGTP